MFSVTTGLSPVIQAIPPPTLINPTQLSVPVAPAMTIDAQKRADQQKKQEELQKKLLEETEPQTLQQQENMSIKGQSARHLVMQKLMRKMEVNVLIVLLYIIFIDKFINFMFLQFNIYISKI